MLIVLSILGAWIAVQAVAAVADLLRGLPRSNDDCVW